MTKGDLVAGFGAQHIYSAQREAANPPPQELEMDFYPFQFLFFVHKSTHFYHFFIHKNAYYSCTLTTFL